MGMSELVERVAIAIGRAFGDSDADIDPSVWMDEARAAIVAMREPTIDMQFAAYDGHGSDVGAAWRKMIDAALHD